MANALTARLKITVLSAVLLEDVRRQVSFCNTKVKMMKLKTRSRRMMRRLAK